MPSTREFEALFEAALDAVFVIDDGRGITAVNPAGCALLGLIAKEIVGHPFDDFLESPRALDEAWRAFLTTGQARGPVRLVRSPQGGFDAEYTAVANFVTGRHFAIVRDVTERVAAEAERAALHERELRYLRETETLLSVSRALSGTLDPTETMRRVARAIARALGADMVGAYLADPAQEALWPVAGYRVPREMLESFQKYPIPIRNHRAIEEAWTHRRAVWTDDMGSDERVDRETYRRFPHQSDLFTPIFVKDRPVGGFFAIWWNERRLFSADERRLLEGIGDLAGIYLDNAQLYRDAEQANRAKDEFIATLSHELRNPLGAITNAAAALDRVGAQNPVAVRLRGIVQRQTRHLARLVDDLLEVARMTAGKVSLDRQVVDLAAVVSRSVEALREAGRGHQHHIVLAVEPVLVNADPLRLEQIVTNVVDNAIKYTPPDGAVRIEVQREGTLAVLRVADTGIGIAEETLPRVFDLFSQGEQPLDRALGGLGIGLALTQRLVQMHGGTIHAASEGPGRGAQFVIRLPVEPVEPHATRVSAPHAETARSILVVEDNPDSRESLRLLLQSLGHRVIDAADGQAGLALALSEQPDIVLVDLGLPGLDGYALARAVRGSERGRSVRLIAVTGYGQAADRRRSAESGFDAHLVKPVSVAALTTLLAS
jgi:PAS domain S-box-containing protein